MPYGEVKLIPGVNVERTPTLLEAGFSESQLIRFRDGLAQKFGGWSRFYSSTVAGATRELMAWQDLNVTNHLLIASTTKLGVLTSDSYVDITPQQKETDPVVDFSTTSGSTSVVVVDTDISNVTTFDAVMLNTPVSVGGLVLWGLYQIETIVGATSYRITAASAATSTVNNGGAVPVFTTTSGSSSVSVLIANHSVTAGQTVTFQTSTTGNGVTVSGSYVVTSVADSSNFSFVVASQATASSSFSMNSGLASITYNITLGPAAAGAGYGSGDYGAGGYGTGLTTSAQTGTQITATDWTSINWGKIALACPMGGSVYQYDPTGGFENAQLIPTAPAFNGGIFVSNALQILFCWGSTQKNAIGMAQDPMLIRWSDLGDYTQFIALTTNQAGSFRIPIGSVIRGGMAVSNQNLFWTDLDLWAANYAGFPLVFGFNKIGAGAGLISSHAAQQLRNSVYWMGPTNFYSYTGSGVAVIPCPIWDVVFQNLNEDYVQNIRAMPNTPFNEVGWLYPSASSSSGECDSYVKFNITEPASPWDYGSLPRSAWIDQTVLGMPISATSNGVIFQQETTNDADGQPMSASFTTGYFYISEGQDFAFVDQILPDMKWGTYAGSASAQVYITVNTVNYPGDSPTTYGPYLMSQSVDYISTRIRARQMSFTFSSSDSGSFGGSARCAIAGLRQGGADVIVRRRQFNRPEYRSPDRAVCAIDREHQSGCNHHYISARNRLQLAHHHSDYSSVKLNCSARPHLSQSWHRNGLRLFDQYRDRTDHRNSWRIFPDISRRDVAVPSAVISKCQRNMGGFFSNRLLAGIDHCGVLLMANPNFIVPTPPSGDSTNRAASTEFVTSAIANFSATIPPIPSTSQVDFISGGIASPTNQDYRIIEYVPFPMTFSLFVAKLSTGTLTALLKVNLTTMVTLNIGTSRVSSIISSANTATTNTVVLLTVSGTADSPQNLSFTVVYTKDLVQ